MSSLDKSLSHSLSEFFISNLEIKTTLLKRLMGGQNQISILHIKIGIFSSSVLIFSRWKAAVSSIQHCILSSGCCMDFWSLSFRFSAPWVHASIYLWSQTSLWIICVVKLHIKLSIIDNMLASVRQCCSYDSDTKSKTSIQSDINFVWKLPSSWS